MLYHEFALIMEEFFKELDFEVVLSPDTNIDILNQGVLSSVDEACLPVKIFHGHVDYLKDKVDYILIPKFISIYENEYCCPKILGLPEMINNSINNLPKILAPVINLNELNSIRNALKYISKTLNINFMNIIIVYNKVYKNHKIRTHQLEKNNILLKIKDELYKDNMTLLLLGHSYNLYDNFLNMNIVKKLVDQNINIIFNTDIPEEVTRQYTSKIPKRMFWTHGSNIVGAAYSLIQDKSINGIIYLSSFGCGMDSVLLHFVLKEAKLNNIPVLNLIFDEQTGEAGLNTRIEAYTDMIRWRLKNENNISALR